LKGQATWAKVELPDKTEAETAMPTIAIPRLYSILLERVLPLVNSMCDSQMTNLILLMLGLYQGRSVHLTRIASKVPSGARKLSTAERLRRFLSNEAVEVHEVYDPVAQELIRRAAISGKIRLVIDSSKVGFGHQLMMVALCYRRRTLPLVWTWIPHKKGHSQTSTQIALLREVKAWLTDSVQVVLLGDSEFGRTLLLEALDRWHWQYVLRQSGHNLVWLKGEHDWRPLDSLAVRGGSAGWYPHTVLTRDSAYPTHLVILWKSTFKEPWLLATNIPCPTLALHLYGRRMWIEEMFGDLKNNGFDLEATHLRAPERLNRLTLAVCLLFVWFIALGVAITQLGFAYLIDRADRRDLSFFRRGFDWLDRVLTLNDALPPGFFPSFEKVLGG
jgi:DDE family transposase